MKVKTGIPMLPEISVAECCVPCLGKKPQQYTPATRKVIVENFPNAAGKLGPKLFRVCVSCYLAFMEQKNEN